MEAADVESNPWLAPSPPLPVDDEPVPGLDDSYPTSHLDGLVARIAAVARRHGNMDVLDLIGTVPDPEPPEQSANSL